MLLKKMNLYKALEALLSNYLPQQPSYLFRRIGLPMAPNSPLWNNRARFTTLADFLRHYLMYNTQLPDCQRILLLGDGDGRGLALACRVAPHAHIDSLDFSAGMLDHAARRLRPEDRARVTLNDAWLPS